MWAVYMLKCSDGSIYIGVTTDVGRRVWEHNHSKRGARYTRARRPVRLLHSKGYPDKSKAFTAEWALKQKTRKQKEIVMNEELEGIFDIKREALREIIGAVNTCVQEGDAISNIFLCSGDDSAIVELSKGAFLTVNLGVIGRDHAMAIISEREEALERIVNKGVNK